MVSPVNTVRWAAIKTLIKDAGYDYDPIADEHGVPQFPVVPQPRTPAEITSAPALELVETIDTADLNPVKLAQVGLSHQGVKLHFSRMILGEIEFSGGMAISTRELIQGPGVTVALEACKVTLRALRRRFPDFDTFNVFERSAPPDEDHKFVAIRAINGTDEWLSDGRLKTKHYVVYQELGDLSVREEFGNLVVDPLPKKIASIPDWCQNTDVNGQTVPAFVPHEHVWDQPVFLDDPNPSGGELDDKLQRWFLGKPSSDYGEDDSARISDMKRRIAAGFYGPGAHVRPCVHNCGWVLVSWRLAGYNPWLERLDERDWWIEAEWW
jgi:hypothetical protein